MGTPAPWGLGARGGRESHGGVAGLGLSSAKENSIGRGIAAVGGDGGDAPSHGKWDAAREVGWGRGGLCGAAVALKGCGLCCCGQMCEMC